MVYSLLISVAIAILIRDSLYAMVVGHSRFAQWRGERLDATHFGRPSFSMKVDKDGKLHIKGGDNPDHATRCGNYFRQRNSGSDYFLSLLEYSFWCLVLPWAGWSIVLGLLCGLTGLIK